MNNTADSYRWKQSFPAVYWHTSTSFLAKCPGLYRAKRGDFQAARAVVGKCVKQRRIDELRQKYQDAVLLPVMTDNKLPIALAQAIGLEVCTAAAMRRGAAGKRTCAMERLLSQPEFARVPPRRYIIVDDVVQSGAICALRKHVVECGGFVEAIVALASSFGGEELMTDENASLTGDTVAGEQIGTVREFFRPIGLHDPACLPADYFQQPGVKPDDARVASMSA